MKQIISILLISICTYYFHSCSSDDETEIRLEISDKYILTEMDFEFYDSSTCILFLKENIGLTQGFIGDDYWRDFSIYVDYDFIFEGIFYPPLAARPSHSPIYIAQYSNDTIDTELLHFMFIQYPQNSIDERNNSRLINSYEKNNLLKNGISCTVENIELSSIDSTILNIELLIINNDDYPYLIPDLSKFSTKQFFLISGGGFEINNRSTGEGIRPDLGDYRVDTSIMSLDNLVILNGLDKKTFSIAYEYKSAIKEGLYSCVLRFNNIDYCLTFSNLNFNQDNGRVWIGEDYSITEFEIK